MKTLIVLASALVASSAFASPKNAILDCTLMFGPDQQVTVLSTPEGLVLEELTNQGSMQRRPLSQEEMSSRTIQLRVGEPFESGTLSRQPDGQWLYNAGGAIGYASCSVTP